MTKRSVVIVAARAVLLLLSLFVVLIFVSSTFAGDLSTMEDRLSCGTTEVQAFTTCAPDPNAGWDERCTEQYFVFADSKARTSVKVPASVQLRERRGAHGKSMGTWLDATAWEWACLKGRGQRPFVLIDYANGGNCDRCEWYEILDLKGHSLASSKVSPHVEEKEARRIRSAFDKKYRELGLPMPWPRSSFRQLRPFEHPRLSE